ncbi:MAG: trypsin-like serine peptidase [Cyanobacteriota bacterium]
MRPILLQVARLPDSHSIAPAGFSGGVRLTLAPACRILYRDPGDRFWFTDCDTFAGDSGSPVLADQGNGMAVVGVTSGLLKDNRGRPGSVVVPARMVWTRIHKLRIPGSNQELLSWLPHQKMASEDKLPA